MIVHFRQFLKYTKDIYFDEINKMKIKSKNYNRLNNKEKIKYEIEILRQEYKILINQKIKDITKSVNEYQKNIIESTYRELEKDKINKIKQLQNTLKEEKGEKKENSTKTTVEWFDEILYSDEFNMYILLNFIDRVWIYSDKTVKFDLNVYIN